MKLVIRHDFAAPLELVVATLACPHYTAHLARTHSFFEQIELLSRQDGESHWQRRMRYRARPFIARLGVFSLPAAWFAWVEHARYEHASGVLAFDNVPLLESVRGRVINRGTMQFTRQTGRTVREARFEIDFKVPPIYRPLKEMALAMVRRQLTRSLDEEAALLAGWLSQNGREVAA
jgi:hypothetical protein